LSSRLEHKDDESSSTSSSSSPGRSRLKQELDSWRPFVEALRQEDREVFRDMMNAISAGYGGAIELAERGYDTEAVMMSILLNQQKTINWILNAVKRLNQQEVKEKASEEQAHPG
jgi:hypothetical protein